MSSPNPSLSLGMSCGPLSFLVEPPGVRSPDLSLLASALGLLVLSTDVPFINEPMLGIVLAWEVLFGCEGVVSKFSCAAAAGVEVREPIVTCICWDIMGEEVNKRGSIGVEEVVVV